MFYKKNKINILKNKYKNEFLNMNSKQMGFFV